MNSVVSPLYKEGIERCVPIFYKEGVGEIAG